MNDQLRLSNAGAQFIAGFEGCILHPYDDPWNATIGIGHLIHYGQVEAVDRARWRGFTYAKALALLRADVRQVEAQVRARVRVGLNQNEWDALVSLVFNCGPGVLEGRVGQLLNAGDRRGAADAWQAWDHAGGQVLAGLQRRRQAERALFLRTVPAYMPADEARWESEYDRLLHKGGPWPALRRRVLRRVMTARRKLIYQRAHSQPHGWDQLNRAARWHALKARTG